MSEFKKAIEERMIANSVWFDGEPKEVLGRLIDYEVLLSLDPKVSERAANLKADAVREAAKVIAGALCAGSAVEELCEYANKLERGEL